MLLPVPWEKPFKNQEGESNSKTPIFQKYDTQNN
jgi:hypothetical protein